MVMAMYKWCAECDVDTLHHNHDCTVCSERERRVKRAEWCALTDGERIELLMKRIEILERKPVRY
jgi:hypothetical protein